MTSNADAQLGRALDGDAAGEPAFAALRIRPVQPAVLPRLRDALGGAGRPVGVARVSADAGALVVEFDPRRTPLSLLVALIDAEVAGARTIEPLRPLDDRTLAAFVGQMLGIPDLDASRIVETHVAALLAESAS